MSYRLTIRAELDLGEVELTMELSEGGPAPRVAVNALAAGMDMAMRCLGVEPPVVEEVAR